MSCTDIGWLFTRCYRLTLEVTLKQQLDFKRGLESGRQTAGHVPRTQTPDVPTHRARRHDESQFEEEFVRDPFFTPVGFAWAILTMSRCNSLGMSGRPGRDFHRQRTIARSRELIYQRESSGTGVHFST